MSDRNGRNDAGFTGVDKVDSISAAIDDVDVALMVETYVFYTFDAVGYRRSYNSVTSAS